MASIENSIMSILSNNENVIIEVLATICNAIGCTLDAIVEIISDKGR